MAADIREWLEVLGLDQYAEAFAENDIDFRALPHIDQDDLKELGVSLGHRKVILAAIEAMNEAREPGCVARLLAPPVQARDRNDRAINDFL